MNQKVDYISLMVAETFGEVQGDLLSFKAPEKTQDQLEMDFSPTRVSYDQSRLCLVLDIEGERFEIPTNFGSFKNVDFQSVNAHFYISTHKDPDALIETLSAHLDRRLEAIEVYVGANGLELDARFSEAHQQAA